MRNYIHIMLCVSLFMAQLVFIIGVDKIEHKVRNSYLITTKSLNPGIIL